MEELEPRLPNTYIIGHSHLPNNQSNLTVGYKTLRKGFNKERSGWAKVKKGKG